jgi:hypothetical protein
MTKEKAKIIAERIMAEVIDQTIGVFGGEERGFFIEDFVRIIMQEAD